MISVNSQYQNIFTLFYSKPQPVCVFLVFSVILEAYRHFLLNPSLILCKLYQSKRKVISPVVTVSSTNAATFTAVDPNVVNEEPIEKLGFKVVQETALANICK